MCLCVFVCVRVRVRVIPEGGVRMFYRLPGRLRLLSGDDQVEATMLPPIIMGVALDVHVSQARWQQLKNMSADVLIGTIISFSLAP